MSEKNLPMNVAAGRVIVSKLHLHQNAHFCTQNVRFSAWIPHALEATRVRNMETAPSDTGKAGMSLNYFSSSRVAYFDEKCA